MRDYSSDCSTSLRCFEIGTIIQNGISFHLLKDVYKWVALNFQKENNLLHYITIIWMKNLNH